MKNVEQQISKFSNRLKNSVKASTNKKAMARLGKILIAVIQRRTRRGFSVKKNLGNRTKLKGLSKNYIKQRKKSKLSRFTSAKKSNLTFTGQLLSSLSLKTRDKVFIIAPSKTRRGSNLTNQKVANYVSKERSFLNISKVEQREILKNFDKSLSEVIKKSLTGL